MDVDPATAVGRSKLLLFGGIAILAIGQYFAHPLAAWGGFALTVIAFGINTVGKVLHYRELSLPTRTRRALVGTWLLAAVLVVWFLWSYVSSVYGGANGSYLIPLAIAGIGFALVHRGFQSKYLGRMESEGEG